MCQYTRSTQQRQPKNLVDLLYTNDKETEKEIRETSPFTIATNNIKYFKVILTKELKDLFGKNFKSLKKEIEKDTRKWKEFHALGYVGST